MSIDNITEELEQTRKELVFIAKQLVDKTQAEVYGSKLLTRLYEFLNREGLIVFDFGEDGTAEVPIVSEITF